MEAAPKQPIKAKTDHSKGSTDARDCKRTPFFQPRSGTNDATFFQPKLAIGPRNDSYEQEANAVAETVVANIEQPVLQQSTSKVIARAACVQRTEDEANVLQRQSSDGGDPTSDAPDIVHDVLQTAGDPLDDEIRTSMETSFGYDFSRVRVHTGPLAAQSAQSINALAYTSGNNIVFNQGQFTPQTSSGKRLLAHELTHVVQQAGGIRTKPKQEGVTISSVNKAQIQKSGEDDLPTTFDLQNGLTFLQWRNQGQGLLIYRGEQWLIFQWTGGLSERVISVNVSRIVETNTLALTFSATFPVTVSINSEAEEYAAGIAGGTLNLSYDFHFPGTAQRFENGDLTERTRTPQIVSRQIVDAPMPEIIEGGELGSVEDDGLLHPLPIAPPLRDFSRVWSFDSQEGFNQFARSHPDTDWACVVLPDGRFVAYALTGEALHRFARNVRAGTYDPNFASQFNGTVSTVFVNGEQLSSLEALGNLYFEDANEAALGLGAPAGMDGSPVFECVVYEMGDGTYGRKPLSHDEALQLWVTLSVMPTEDVYRYEVEPGHVLTELNVRGRSNIHSINRRYFRGRDAYYDIIRSTRALGSRPEITTANEDEMYYMRTEVDRPDVNISFQESLEQNSLIATNLQEQVYQQVENVGQQVALQLLRDSHTRFDQMATDTTALNSFIVGFHALSPQEKVEALAMIGLVRHPRGTLPFITAARENMWYDEIMETLSTLDGARRVLLGLDLFIPTILQDHARTTADGIQRVIDALENRSVIAIRAEGDFGEQVRNIAYREMGFTRLRGDTFPHTGEVDQFFPGPMSGTTASFGSIAEQLYANRIVQMTNEERVMHFIGVTAVILGTAVLIIISGGIGTFAAGLFLAEGTAAFIAAEVVVGGIAFTALNEFVGQATGGGEFSSDDLEGSVEQLGSTAVSNIVTFGFFRGLNALFGAMGRVAVGGGTIARGSARAVVADSIRLTGLFSTTYFSSIVGARISTGHYPDNDELLSLFYENALTLVALEVGGRLAHPLISEAGIYARGRRLGPTNARNIDALVNDIATLQEELATYVENPAGRPVTDLIVQQRQILARQAALVQQLRETARGTGDAEIIERMGTEELARIEETLALIRDVQFISDTRMRSAGADDATFYYREGTIERIREHYGNDNVRGPDREGVVLVTQGERTLTFRPEPVAGETSPTGAGAVRGDVYGLGNAAGAETLGTTAGDAPLSISHIFRFLTVRRGATTRIHDSLVTRMHDSVFSWPGENAPYYELTVPTPGGSNVVVRVTIKFQGLDTRGTTAETPSAGPHGEDTGPATYRLLVVGGELQAIVDINPNIQVDPAQRSRSPDFELVIGHELDEIADITRQLAESPTLDQSIVDAAVNREAQAVVFRPGSTAPPTSATAHDRAAAAQLRSHFGELARGGRAAELRFVRMLDSMGLTGRTTASEFAEFRRALELSTSRDIDFLNRVEVQWRLLATQRVLETLPEARLLPGGQRAITTELIDHILFPHNNSPGDFMGSGISGGHQTTNLEALNNDAASPYAVVREGSVPLGPGRNAHRYHQYQYIGPNPKTSAAIPDRVPGGPTAEPVPGTHYDPHLWEVSRLPKSAVDDMNTFLPAAEEAFAQHFRNTIEGNPMAEGNGRMFTVTVEGVSYMGYYNYDGTTVSLNSIFIDATTIP